MSSRSLEISEIRIPLETISALSPHQRYTYYLLGHVFNEMMTLQKIIGFSLPKHADRRAARRSAEVAQSFFLFRLAASKIYEFQAVINAKEVKTSLDELVFKTSPQLRDELRDFNRAVGGAAWLSRMRNGMGFHYPNFNQWEEYTTPNDAWIEDVVYFSKEAGNTFFDASASIALHWMFDQYRKFDAPSAVLPLGNELVDLIKKVNWLTESMVGTIIDQIAPELKPLTIGKVLVPEQRHVTIPYWTHFKTRE